jgi:hypothetical protein
MKRTLLFLAILTAGSLTQARSFKTLPEVKVGNFEMYATPQLNPEGYCDVGTQLIIENVNGLGAVAILKDFVNGVCEIYVPENLRIYTLSATQTGCGSKIYTGKVRSADSLREIEIVDHRARVCKDLVPARIIMKELEQEQVVSTLYSFDEVIVQEPVVVTPQPQGPTCMAYFQGYVKIDGVCKLMGKSGCSNTFKHKTLESCQSEK